MEIPLQLKQVSLGELTLNLFVPDEHAVQESYKNKLAADLPVTFPYWAKIWPSAMAMCRLLAKRPELYSGKTVIELAAGLGLPSLVASRLAAKVICSDYQQEAVDTIYKSVKYNRYSHMEVILLDWNNIPEDLNGDLLLLSDVNYEPAAFKILESLVRQFLEQGSTIVLSTPQRLMAKPFIATIMEFIEDKEEFNEPGNDDSATISVLTLKK